MEWETEGEENRGEDTIWGEPEDEKEHGKTEGVTFHTQLESGIRIQKERN